MDRLYSQNPILIDHFALYILHFAFFVLDKRISPADNRAYWNGNRGAATLGDGAKGITRIVDATNSLVGSNAGDHVGGGGAPGRGGVVALSNGNYVVASPDWSNHRGAVTWGDGTMGITGFVDETNSLIG